MTRSQSIVWLLLSIAVWFLVVMIMLPPFVGLEWRAVIMSAFRPLCHQIADRSPAIDGVQLAVCHRCFGIYAALAVSVTIISALIGFSRTLEPYARFVLPASLVPIAIDWGGDVIGLWANTPVSRFATGAVFGAVGGVYLVRAILVTFADNAPAAVRNQDASG